jgi:F1F0 ATPase subunit 2
MNETSAIVGALLAGVVLGMIYFGGLWWTIRKGLSSKRPAVWFIGSLLLRTTIALAGVYLVSSGHWQRMLACLAGLFLARAFVTRFAHAPVDAKMRIDEGDVP